MSETSPLKKIGFVYLFLEMSEGNVYIPVKEKIMRVRDSCLAIIFEVCVRYGGHCCFENT